MRWRRRVMLAGVCLVGGLGINLMLAGLCLCVSRTTSYSQSGLEDWRRQGAIDVAMVEHVGVSFGLRSRSRHWFWTSEPPDRSFQIRRQRKFTRTQVEDVWVGWPLPVARTREAAFGTAMTADAWSVESSAIATRPRVEGVLSWAGTGDDRPVPTVPLVPGLLFNSALFASIIAVLILAPRMILRACRRELGTCVACGYALKGMARCPECGVGVAREAPSTSTSTHGALS